MARGTRSEQALTLALAEMEVQSVSTRKASAIMKRLLRTPNAIERVNQELKRRPRVAPIFSNEASLLRLAHRRGQRHERL